MWQIAIIVMAVLIARLLVERVRRAVPLAGVHYWIVFGTFFFASYLLHVHLAGAIAEFTGRPLFRPAVVAVCLAVTAAVLMIAAWQLNPLAWKLSPAALGVLFFYSYTKRFTSWSHLVLGFCLGMSPAAAWIAIAGSLDWRMLILCAAVTLWVGGFDVLYACQDIEYDRSVNLFSVPKRFGVAKSLVIARAMHILMIALLAWLAWSFHLPWPAWAGIVVVAGLLAYEHSLVSANDLSRLNAAFFTVNGYISLLFLLFWGAAVAVAHP